MQALTLGNPTDRLDGAQELLRARHEGEVALAADQDKTEQLKSENVKKNLSLSGLSAGNNLKMISHLTNPEKKTGDQLDALARRFNFRTDEASAAAYGDEKAVAQYNALLNVQLPPFFGTLLSLPNGGRCSFIWWIRIQKSPRAPSNCGRGKPPQERSYGTPSAGPPSTSNNEGSGQNPSLSFQGGQNPLLRQGNGCDLLPCLFCGQH